MNMPDLPPAPIQEPSFPDPLPMGTHYVPQTIFNAFGGNWKWASIDYRGVARVHTFEPKFTVTGRVELPMGTHNSEPAPAFNLAEVPDGFKPFVVFRHMLPPYFTDRFGAHLPIGADPVEAADVMGSCAPAPMPQEPEPMLTDRIAVAEFFNVPLTAPPAPISAVPDVPFMNYVVQYRLVGSRVTCNPPPLDTDQDVLCMVHQDNRELMLRKMTAEGFTLEGSWPADMQCTTPNNSVFESMRKGSMNYIITSDDDFYKRFNAATELAKKLNIMTKAGRIELFQAVLYGNAP